MTIFYTDPKKAAIAEKARITKVTNERKRKRMAALFRQLGWLDAASVAELVTAVEDLLGSDYDHTNLPCHLGITTPAQCARCRREKRVRELVTQAKAALP